MKHLPFEVTGTNKRGETWYVKSSRPVQVITSLDGNSSWICNMSPRSKVLRLIVRFPDTVKTFAIDNGGGDK